MEDLATKNVEKVGNVATSVTDHNKKSWRSTLATWTILFAVLGSFLFCMMTIRMVPKQRNKCLFLCGETHHKEVCNRMDDGSIVCVDTKGNPYVKKAAPVARREAEEAKRVEECEMGDNGVCIAPVTAESHGVRDGEKEAEATGPTDGNVCDEEGECKAQYDDDGPKPSESEIKSVEIGVQVDTEDSAQDAVVVTDDVCSEEGECKAQYADDEPESPENEIKSVETGGQVDTEDSVQEDVAAIDDICSEEGECKAHSASDEPESPQNEIKSAETGAAVDTEDSAQEEVAATDDVCSEEGECKAHYADDEPGSPESEIKSVETGGERNSDTPNEAREDQEHLQALEQVVEASNVVNASALEEIHAEGSGQEANEALSHRGQVLAEQAVVEDVVDEAAQPTGGISEEHIIMADRDEVGTETADTATADKEPADVPATQEDDRQENRPTVVSSQDADSEINFKPAEISTMHERFDEDENERVNEKTDFTATDVHLAAHWGQNEVLKRYLHLMPHYTSDRDENGWQLIHEAANAGRAETMKMLLDEFKADINARAGLVNDGATPLFLAYKEGYDDSSEVVTFIKSRGGVSIAPGQNAPYKLAAQHTAEELEQYNLKDFHLAAAKGDDIRVAQYIVARRDLLNQPDENGWLAIHEAVRYGHKISAQLLIDAGTDINARTGSNRKGWSPLGLAVQRFGEENPVTRLLRRHNAEMHLPE